jgi:orotidine-5'-phosphate decarboxylase
MTVPEKLSHNPLVLALDAPDADDALRLIRSVGEGVGAYKIGLELSHAAGSSIFARARDAGAQRIFYDPKLSDIPNTVAGACRVIGGWGLWMLSVHTLSGLAAMRAAREAADEGAARADVRPPLLIGITLLTSLDESAVRDELGLSGGLAANVVRLAGLARQAGMDGVVASPHEAAAIRRECGPEFLIVTPGIRPAGAAAGDQKRFAAPAQALQAGADYLVVGRAVTGAADPRLAADALLAEALGT